MPVVWLEHCLGVLTCFLLRIGFWGGIPRELRDRERLYHKVSGHLLVSSCLLAIPSNKSLVLTMLMRTIYIFSILFGCVLFTGCATSSEPVRVAYDAASNQTTYQTGQMQLSDIEMTSGLQKQNRFYVQVVGQCSGQDCFPSKYRMKFIKQGTQSVRLEGRGVSLTIGTETITWEDPQTRETTQTTTIRSGTFAQIEMSSGQLATVGGVSDMSGSVGGTDFTIPHDHRAPIRSLLSRLNQSSNESANANS